MGILLLGIVRVGVILGKNFAGGNCPGGSYRGWELSEWELSWVGIVWVGVILGSNFFWWEFSRWELSSRNHPKGDFPVASFHITQNPRARGEHLAIQLLWAIGPMLVTSVSPNYLVCEFHFSFKV